MICVFSRSFLPLTSLCVLNQPLPFSTSPLSCSQTDSLDKGYTIKGDGRESDGAIRKKGCVVTKGMFQRGVG